MFEKPHINIDNIISKCYFSTLFGGKQILKLKLKMII
jgi:hypothetical protein